MKKIALLAAAIVFPLMAVHAQDFCGQGYRGHVDAGYSIGIGDYDFDRFEVNTSHGYQFNPFFFVGAGVGIHFMSSYATAGMEIPLDQRESLTDVPVFGHLRCNFMNRKFSPFVDLRGGYFVTNSGGLYLNAAVGCRYAFNEKMAVNLSVGYTREDLEFDTFEDFFGSHSMHYYTSGRKLSAEAVALKLGFEF